MPPPRRSQAERREQTRGALLGAARELFATVGYGAVSLEDIVVAAGVTRGALYHHFADKTAVFRAVYEQIEAECVAEIGAVVDTVTDVESDIRKAASAFLDMCERPDVRRIALQDAPTVLGWQTWREIEARYSLGMLVARLELAAADGVALPAAPEVLASLILSTAMEAALVIANSPDPAAARGPTEHALRAMVRGLVDGS